MTEDRRGKSGADNAGRDGEPVSQRKMRRGRPNPASIVSEKTFVSPGGKRYGIIRTDEQDAYDKPIVKPRGR